ncbi:hypothetical protein DFP72DRAFT_1152311 [Ephemerocybe angulata]|uniref:Uncharacterized protein n=1 Tax=Ephemerocybe angulata TaxID=980116 RepID=A0A8H6HHK7_9AGAR|nr:hypothetical protein DFP72DRAFT_1152311 [Tulosesus angulatus]
MRVSFITLLPIALSLVSLASAHHDVRISITPAPPLLLISPLQNPLQQPNEAREDVGTLSSRGLGDEFALERREALEDIATRDLLDELEGRLARRIDGGPKRRFYCDRSLQSLKGWHTCHFGCDSKHEVHGAFEITTSQAFTMSYTCIWTLLLEIEIVIAEDVYTMEPEKSGGNSPHEMNREKSPGIFDKLRLDCKCVYNKTHKVEVTATQALTFKFPLLHSVFDTANAFPYPPLSLYCCVARSTFSRMCLKHAVITDSLSTRELITALSERLERRNSDSSYKWECTKCLATTNVKPKKWVQDLLAKFRSCPQLGQNEQVENMGRIQICRRRH